MESKNEQIARNADALKHPSSEQWMDFLHGELSTKARIHLKAHLCKCQICRTQIAEWKGTMGALDEWTLPEKIISPNPIIPPWVRWAAAALVILGVGFGVGRLNARTPDMEKIRGAVSEQVRTECQKAWQSSRAELVESLRSELDQTAIETLTASSAEMRRLLSEFNTTYALDRAEDKEAVLAAWGSLRKELETVAVLTQESLDKAQSQLVKLASITETSGTLPNH